MSINTLYERHSLLVARLIGDASVVGWGDRAVY